ncbi:hypothetical protein YC2023_059667 [Brassica napus]
MHISTKRSKDELLFFSDPLHLERSIHKEKRTTSIDTTSTTSIDTCDRVTIDSSTRTSIDTNPRADMVATLVLQRDENGDLHELEGHMCNEVGQKIDGQWTAILEPFAAIEDAKIPRQRTLADLIWPRQFYTNRSAIKLLEIQGFQITPHISLMWVSTLIVVFLTKII